MRIDIKVKQKQKNSGVYNAKDIEYNTDSKVPLMQMQAVPNNAISNRLENKYNYYLAMKYYPSRILILLN